MRRALLLAALAGGCEEPPPAAPAPDAGCGSVADVEARILVPRCGAPGDGSCHATGAAPPRIGEVGRIVENLLDVRGTLHCHRDAYVSRGNPAASYLLAKLRAPAGGTATCSDGSNGGPAMPYQDMRPLSRAEAACLEWWVQEISR